MHEPISNQRLAELQQLAWNPALEPPRDHPLRLWCDALRDAVREIDRFNGRRIMGTSDGQALLHLLAKHNIKIPEERPGQPSTRLYTDLMEWAHVMIARTDPQPALDDDFRRKLAAFTATAEDGFREAIQQWRDSQPSTGVLGYDAQPPPPTADPEWSPLRTHIARRSEEGS